MAGTDQKDLLRRMLEHRAERVERLIEGGSRPDLRSRLREIRQAERRLRSGSYGFCEGCHLSIPWGELIAVPERRRCARCAPVPEEILVG
jgi:RNA polymerase-binding transcription factor DksA